MANKNSLQKYRGLFFSIGIVMALFAAWQVLSWKTFVSNSALEDKVRLRDLKPDIIQPPQTKPKPPAPPKEHRPRKDKDLLKTFEISLVDEVLKDLESETDFDPVDPLAEVVDIGEDVLDTANFIPIWQLDRLPIFKGCEALEGAERDACLQQSIRQFVAKEFNPKYIAAFPNQSTDVKIYVSFTIRENGQVGNIEVINHQNMGQLQEAMRVFKSLPEFQPALFRGRPVQTTLKLPIQLRSY